MTTTTLAPRTYEPHGVGLKHPAWLLLIIPAVVACLIVLFLVAAYFGANLTDTHP